MRSAVIPPLVFAPGQVHVFNSPSDEYGDFTDDEVMSGSGQEEGDSDSVFGVWRMVSFSGAADDESFVRLTRRPNQLYYIYSDNVTLGESSVCRWTVAADEVHDGFREQVSTQAGPVDLYFYCQKFCCELDCCEINTWIISLLTMIFIVVFVFATICYLKCSFQQMCWYWTHLHKTRRKVRRMNAKRKRMHGSVHGSPVRTNHTDRPKSVRGVRTTTATTESLRGRVISEKQRRPRDFKLNEVLEEPEVESSNL